jgi:archaemetzincin
MKITRLRTYFLASLVTAAAAFWWFKTPPPSVGGGQGEDFLAPWVKNRIYASIILDDAAGFSRLTPENTNGWYNISREPIQSFDYYRSLNPPRPTKQRKVIVLQPIGPFTTRENSLLEDLRKFCDAFFQLPVRLEKPLPLPVAEVKTRLKISSSHGIGDKQFNADEILEKMLARRLPEDAVAYLGITMADLYVNDLSFVFGLGSSDSRTGVYSLTRYFPNSTQTLTKEEQRLGLRRSCQVLDHEMGHMLGLYHCVLYKCSMNGCNSLADADSSPLDYCPVCHQKLLWNLGGNGEKRYRELLSFYEKHGLTDEAKWTQRRLANWRRVITGEELGTRHPVRL